MKIAAMTEAVTVRRRWRKCGNGRVMMTEATMAEETSRSGDGRGDDGRGDDSEAKVPE